MLELRDLGHAYAVGSWVFRGVSLAVPAGTATAVLGANGSGKTTLVRCAAGQLAPLEGTVQRDGAVGFVPQARAGGFAYLVRDMVLMGRARHIGVLSVPARRDHAAAESAMERVGIAHLAGRPYPSLSGGEQQLVLIARAVASGSPILVLDEPATGLDLHHQGRILLMLQTLVAEGLAVLFTTHHPDHALFLCDAVVLMHRTRPVQSGSAEQLLTEGSLSDLYGVPVRRVEYTDADGPGQALVARYESAGSARTGALPLSPSPVLRRRARDPR